MAHVIKRIPKDRGYTIMSNLHFRERGLSLKSKGLLSLILSLPDDWDYSIMGLTSLSKDGKDSVMSSLDELREFGYVRMTSTRNNKGQYETIYEVFEEPNRETQCGKSESGNPTQYNTNSNSTTSSPIINNSPTYSPMNKKRTTNINSPSIPQGDECEEMSQEKILFEEFRKIYLGTKRGLDIEFTNFCKKHKDWREVLPYLKVNYERQIAAKKSQRGSIDPRYEKHLQTYINQRCWEEEISYGSNQTTNTKANNQQNDTLRRISDWAHSDANPFRNL